MPDLLAVSDVLLFANHSFTFRYSRTLAGHTLGVMKVNTVFIRVRRLRGDAGRKIAIFSKSFTFEILLLKLYLVIQLSFPQISRLNSNEKSVKNRSASTKAAL